MKLTGLSDLLASERGVFAIVLLAIATTLLYFERMTVAEWTNYTMWIGGVLIIGKTITTAVDSVTQRPAGSSSTTISSTTISSAASSPVQPGPAPAPTSPPSK